MVSAHTVMASSAAPRESASVIETESAVVIDTESAAVIGTRCAHEGTPGGAAVADPDIAESAAGLDRPWLTIVWDDPVNLMRYVTFVFQKIFGYSETHANELMMQVHTEGKAVVSTGDRDKVETDVQKLQAAGLWATMQRDS